jgi:DNA-binding LacI/PurR family transcriptional regulator
MNIPKKFVNKTLHSQVADALRQDIMTIYQPGQKLEGEVKLAQRLGVSPLTLRQAFAVLVHEGLIERRNGSGTYVADDLERPYVAIFTSTSSDLRDTDFQRRIFQICGSLVRERGYSVHLHVLPEGFRAEEWSPFSRRISHGRVCGALFIAIHPGPLATVLAQKDVPYVVTDEGFSHGVLIDSVPAVREGTRYLLERGCRRIALMQWCPYTTPTPEYEAFQAVLAEHHVPVHEKWIRRNVPLRASGAGWEQFREIWTARDEKPDGLLVLDDVLFAEVALGILDSHVKVPDQLQVVTHANKGSPITYPFPVTLLEVDPNEFAGAMTDLLIKLINKEPMETPIKRLHPRLIPAGVRKGELAPVA